MKCPNCQSRIDKKAKFCQFCGTRVTVSSNAETTQVCFSCNHPISSDAKFCNHCGARQSQATDDGVAVHKRYITWHILPGQLALKIDERTMDEYRSIRGLYIAPGARALFFINGKFITSLGSGKYPFEKMDDTSKSETAARGFLRSVAAHIANGVAMLFSGNQLNKDTFYTVLLVKDTDFALSYEIPDVTVGSVKMPIALHMLCAISDVESFFAEQLTDKKYVSARDFSEWLRPSIAATLNMTLRNFDAKSVSDNTQLIAQLQPMLNQSINTIYPYVTLKHIVRLTSEQQGIEELRQEQERLYFDNEHLTQLQLRNELLNRVQGEEYEQKLLSARSAADFRRLMDEIDRDRLMNADTQDSFLLQLDADRRLREARSQTDVDAALDQMAGAQMLSREAVDRIREEILYRAKDQKQSHDGLLAISVLRNHISVEKEKLDWEIEKGNRQYEDRLAREKTDFAWKQERLQKESELHIRQEKEQLELLQKQNAAKLDMQRQYDAHRLDMLRQAQAIRKDNQRAAHERELELRKQADDTMLAKQKMALDAELEEQRLYFGMTAEQIMVANPHITPEAAMAMSKKFEAEAQAAKSEDLMNLMKQHNADLKELMKDQQQLAKDVIELELKHSEDKVESKQQELNRMNETADKHEDRLLNSLGIGATATASAIKSTGSIEDTLTALALNANQTESTVASKEEADTRTVICSSCGSTQPADSKFCTECGSALS